MRSTWTDDRLDDLVERMKDGFARGDKNFKEIDRRFDRIDERFERHEAKFDEKLDQVVLRMAGIERVMIQAMVALTSAIVAGFAAICALIASQA